MEQQKHQRTIGMHFGKPIAESIYNNNHRYVFDRIAECNDEGCPLDQLSKNEILIRPGLIYKQAS